VVPVSDEERAGLSNGMVAAVYEEAFLFELALGAVEDHGGLKVVHALAPLRIARAIRVCFELGWLRLLLPTEHVERWASDAVLWLG
jgi:hypothetical protein